MVWSEWAFSKFQYPFTLANFSLRLSFLLSLKCFWVCTISTKKIIKAEIRMKRFMRFFFLSLLCWSGFKAIFHCSAQPFSRYLFSIFAVRSGSETIENKEVSSLNNLKFDFRLVAKSFMYTRKKEALKLILV